MSAVDAVFHCRMCGHCCQGRGGIVVSPADLTRLAGHLGLPEADVLQRCCERLGGKWQLRVGADGFCIFFRPGAGCGVHAGKPPCAGPGLFFAAISKTRPAWKWPKTTAPASPLKRPTRILPKSARLFVRTRPAGPRPPL